MTTRPRFLLSMFRSAVFLVIAFGISPSTEGELTEESNARASATHTLLPISIQETQAKEQPMCRWSCTCQYYYDRKPHKWAGQWSGEVKAPGRWTAEIAAQSWCESETASKGVNCKWRECSCGNSKPKGRCE